ncbi:MAG: hypothetical protein INR69_07100 [Mucilaginibacter polytrichastri]|nr:hypothetical protein [Mucilaginibacter polytrichastri]
MNQIKINRTILAIGLVLSCGIALSVHVYMIQGLHIPGPDLALLSKYWRYVSRYTSVLALMAFWLLTVRERKWSFIRQWLILALVYCALNESLRGAIMQGYCTNAIGYALLGNVPDYAEKFILCALVVLAVSLPFRKRFIPLTALAISLIQIFLLSPYLKKGWAPVMDALSDLAPKGEWCTLPYGPDLLIPAYATFIEAAVGCMFMAVLVWKYIPGPLWFRYAFFTLLIPTMRNIAVFTVVYPFVGKDTFAMNLAGIGQFTLEFMVLAFCSAYTVNRAMK